MCAHFHADWDVQSKFAGIQAYAQFHTSDFFLCAHTFLDLSIRQIPVWNPHKSLYTRPQIYEIFRELPTKVQVALLSATMPADLLEFTKSFMQDPKKILVKTEELTLEGI